MVFGLVCRAPAQVFNCGSTGALGDVVITTNTEWAMPDNGQFHLNSLIVTNNATLTFLKPTSGLNPPVYLLSRGNVVISGRISVDGQPGQLGGAVSPGGPGGFAGGSSGYIFGNPTNGGDGYGPGRGRFLFANGPGSFGTSNISSSAAGPTYGSLPLLPLIGGSGGAGCSSSPGSSGGGGGGAILIASDSSVTINAFSGASNGIISARGGSNSSLSCPSGGGSGGAIRIVAPVIIGSGVVDVSGGGLSGSSQYSGGNGRVRFDCKTKDPNIQVLLGSQGQIPPWSVGRNPLIFIPNPPILNIVQAAGTFIPEGTNGAVFITLAAGASSNQVVTLQARNFTQTFQYWVDVTPQSGSSWRTNFIWQTPTDGATNGVNVNIPPGTPTRITAWADYTFSFNEH
jgi:hypothetical protein